MSAVTKGPWLAKRLATYDEPGYVILWPDKGGAHMRRLDYRGCFTEADARLIAAAPELYEALVACVADMETTEDFYGKHPAAQDVIANARAALSKATGEQV